jgi:hypothetical protein
MKTLLARRDRHGWSWAELSRRSGLPVWTLRWWRRRLASKPAPRRPVRGFVRVRVVEPPRADGSPLEVITSSGVRVLVGPRFDAEHLSQVIRALESGC